MTYFHHTVKLLATYIIDLYWCHCTNIAARDDSSDLVHAPVTEVNRPAGKGCGVTAIAMPTAAAKIHTRWSSL